MTLLCGIMGETYFLVSGDIIGRGGERGGGGCNNRPRGRGKRGAVRKVVSWAAAAAAAAAAAQQGARIVEEEEGGDFINDRRGMAGVTDEVGG